MNLKEISKKLFTPQWQEVIPPFMKQKYVLTSVVFVFWIGFIDSNNLIEQWETMRELREMYQVRDYYKQKVQQNTNMLHELKTNSKVLERYAREQYYMKRPNEDVFIIEK
jgi:cell division protein FtsB